MAGECVICGRSSDIGVPLDEDHRCASCILREVASLSGRPGQAAAKEQAADELHRFARRLERITEQLPENHNTMILAEAARYVRLAAQALYADAAHGDDDDQETS
jgi:hypothetical protein